MTKDQKDKRITAREAYEAIRGTRDSANPATIRKAALLNFIPFESHGRNFLYKDLDSIVNGLRAYRIQEAKKLVAQAK